MVPLHKRIHENNAERGIVLEKRPQHVGLIPSPPFVYPLFWVLKRIKDVMDVDIHSGRKAWQYFEEDAIYIAADLAHMCRVNEQDVVRLKRFKLTYVNVL